MYGENEPPVPLTGEIFQGVRNTCRAAILKFHNLLSCNGLVASQSPGKHRGH